MQVAPPQDSRQRTAARRRERPVLHPWWEVYQPVDYNLTSRMGNEAQFKAMVATCRKAGVKVIVDTVINHMTGQGTPVLRRRQLHQVQLPGLYTPADFHSTRPRVPGRRRRSIPDFNDYMQVFNCELVGLSDLRTETDNVRDHSSPAT